MVTVTLIFNNGLPFGACKSREMADIVLKSNKVPREYKITSRETTRGVILDACYVTMREIHIRNLLNESEVFGLSGSSDGVKFDKKPLMNEIVHGTHNPVLEILR